MSNPYQSWPSMNSIARNICGAAVFFILIFVSGCAASNIQPVQQAPPPAPPVFPPQTVIQSGDYESFFVENSEVLKSCQDPDKCAEALFNLSFVHCYPKSPYYNPRLGLKYIQDLITAVPDGELTAQAMVWKDLIEKSMKKSNGKRLKREDNKVKEASEPPEAPEDSVKLVEDVQERDWEADRQRMEDEIRSRNEIIEKLSKLLERSRQIDIEMEEKERGLLK